MKKEINLGFKLLTEENCFEADYTSTIFCEINTKTGQSSMMTGKDWARYFLEPKLSTNVPLEVKRLYEVARGTIIYGYFFYPLFSVGIEQLTRITEAAITEKCLLLNLKRRRDNFQSKIKALKDNSIINEVEFEFWESSRKSRNSFSHPENQQIFLPAMAFRILMEITEEINKLFDKQ